MLVALMIIEKILTEFQLPISSENIQFFFETEKKRKKVAKIQ